MMYENKNIIIPTEKRRELNDKLLAIIDNPEPFKNISKEDVFNCYTGEGGLHDLERTDFHSYHDYSKAKKEIEQGQFFTPHHICKIMAELIQPSKTDLIGDFTCGIGSFFNYLPVQQNIYGCEIDIKAAKVARYLYPQANIEAKDIRFYNPSVKLDIVFGNPPFNLQWEVAKEEFISQLYYCIKAAQLLKPGGILFLITPGSFLADDFTDQSLIREINEQFNFIFQMNLPLNSFKNLGVDRFKTKILMFQRKSENIPDSEYCVKTFFNGSFEECYNTIIKPVLDNKEKIKSQLVLELNRGNISDNNWCFSNRSQNSIDGFEFQLKKHLFEIKTHPALSDYYANTLNYLEKFRSQQKPNDMDWKTWDKAKITEPKVLAYLKATLKKQNKKEVDKIELVKTNYGLKFKAYSEKAKRRLLEIYKTPYYSFKSLVLSYPVHLPLLDAEKNKGIAENLILRKREKYLNQNIPFSIMPKNEQVNEFIEKFRFKDRHGNPTSFNPIQKNDLGKILQKNYSELNWQQGSGKTPAAYAWLCYNKEKVKNTFVISAALAINLTWIPFLEKHGENFVHVKSIAEVDRLQKGQIILISVEMLVRLQKWIKKYIRMQSYKVALVFDESDEITNHNSQKTKGVLNCFRKARFKLNATGTTTRNNINELYSQLELLYNNSINMLCKCESIYKEVYVEGEGKKIKVFDNKHYYKPFPAYFGNGLFKVCFSPTKASVFGVQKGNQDIYNKDFLIEIIEKTIVTRQFWEIAGKDKYKIVPHTINQNDQERAVYRKILNEFLQICPLYFASTGNSRKDGMLRIIRQINLLIKATSIPHLFKEYNYNANGQLPAKFNKVFSLLREFENQKVAIGCTTIDASDLYYSHIKTLFPSRPIFLIQGEVSFKQRQQIIAEFEATQDGILISTQQSLKSSINIPTCSQVIIESLPWNIPKLAQYYFRFIRYDSVSQTRVHIITYNRTIEQNLLALLMAKERINEFVKTLEYKDQSDIYQEFDIDMNILNNLLIREKDEKGKLNITWGQQAVA